MRKNHFWALVREGDRIILHRFRTDADRKKWWLDGRRSIPAECEDDRIIAEQFIFNFIPATHPEVRRIQRRMAQGEQIAFPVEV